MMTEIFEKRDDIFRRLTPFNFYLAELEHPKMLKERGELV